MRLKLVFAMAFLLVAQRASTLAQATDSAAAISGGWKLNMEASINPNGPDGPGARGGRGGGEFAAPGKGPSPGGDLGKEELQRFNTHLAMFRKAPPLLGIKATDKEVTLAYDPDPAKGPIYKYMADGKKSVMATPGGPLDVKVKWNGKVLRREVESKESLKVVEEYTPSADGKQLVVTVDVSNIMVRMPKVEIKRVYDRVQ
ncbi:MAG TPA: hypothetical protein VMZ90_04380 [Vicinamibacterales bacterium]|nr:hypothetical protein [Vicinamibacterales bacterium]